MKREILEKVAKISLAVGKREVHAGCRCIYHQPRVPEELLKQNRQKQ